MFKEVLTDNQIKLLKLIQEFKNNFYLVGGTAIALQLCHRRSIDFDLFTNKPLDTIKITRIIKKRNYIIDATLAESPNELTMIISGVKITFFMYPFTIEHSLEFDDIITLPELLTLASMKAYSLGRRSKWKDYVDLYFILKEKFTIKEISRKTKEIFEGGFNERLFRQQLCYFDDIDFSENIEFIKESISNDTIKKFLVSIVTEI